MDDRTDYTHRRRIINLKIITDMFGLFKKKSPKEKLEAKYKKLIEEAHKLSHTNRKESDLKTYEADQVLKEIEKL